MFCGTCVKNAMEARMALSVAKGTGSPVDQFAQTARAAMPFGGDEDEPEDGLQVQNLRDFDEVLVEISLVNEVKRAARQEVQKRWNHLFSQHVLRRLRKYLAERDPLYADDNDDRANQGREDVTAIHPELAVDVRDALSLRHGHDRGHAEEEETADHLEGLRQARQATLARQRKNWVAHELDYSLHTAAAAAEDPAGTPIEAVDVSQPGQSAGSAGTTHPSLNPYFQQHSTMRLSHVVIDVAEETSDDDDEEDEEADADLQGSLDATRRPSNPPFQRQQFL